MDLHPQRPCQRVTGASTYEVGAPRDHARLWAPEQFVAGETHQVRAGCDSFGDNRLAWKSIGAHVYQRTRIELDEPSELLVRPQVSPLAHG